MLRKQVAALSVVALCLFAGACATSRSELVIPPPQSVAVPQTGPAVVIRSIVDERTFEVAPRDPSTPSIGTAGGDVRARAVGRKRNTYGHALGDVLLAQGESVDSVLRQHLVAVFAQAGVRVVDEAAANSETPRVDVHVTKFWSWFQPGFWAITLHAQIETNLVVAGNAPVLVSVEAQHGGQVDTDGMWREVLNRALESYRQELSARAHRAPFVTEPLRNS